MQAPPVLPSQPSPPPPQPAGSSLPDPHVPSPPFQKHGVTLSDLADFVRACGGREAFSGLTTGDVSERFVKPMTASGGVSYCDLLRAQGRDVAAAQVFISHAWGYKFLDVVDALCDHFSDRRDVVIWFDLFSNSQHRAGSLPFEWWETTFRTAIEGFKHTVLVLAPWKSPVVFTRAWCLFEIFTSVVTGSRFDVAMAAGERAAFVKDIRRDYGAYFEMLAEINVMNSTSSSPSDKDSIFRIVKGKDGFGRVNSVVLEKMRGWVLSALEAAVPHAANFDDEMGLKMALASLYAGQAKNCEAEALLEECVRRRGGVLGRDHPLTLASMSNLGDVYLKQGKYELAEGLHVECLATRRGRGGGMTADTLASMNNLGAVYSKQGRHEVAEGLLRECWMGRRAVLGEDHADTVASTQNLGALCCELGKYEEAEMLVKDCLDKRRDLMGGEHANTLRSMSNLANVYSRQGKCSQAEELLVDVLQKRGRVLGGDHPETLHSMSSLANVCDKQRKLDEAEALYAECLRRRTAALGAGHRDTLAVKHKLGHVFLRQERVDEAEAVWAECLSLRRDLLGAHDADTLTSLRSLGGLYSQQRMNPQAETLLVECLEGRRGSLGSDHADTLAVMHELGTVFVRQRKFGQAERLWAECLGGRRAGTEGETLSTMELEAALASLYATRGEVEQAEELYNGVITRGVEKLGETHEAVVRWKNNYGVEMQRQWGRRGGGSASAEQPSHRLDLRRGGGAAYSQASAAGGVRAHADGGDGSSDRAAKKPR
jgi:tetratricopeptide (TPR) repeat protein